MRKILVTGIGGVVGQGILRNILDMPFKFRILGANVVKVSPGNYLCDEVFEVPFAYHDEYIPRMRELSQQEDVSLIIPSTDYESYYLGANKHLFNCPIACSPAEITKMCLDKYLNYKAFSEKSIPFATSILPSQYNGQFKSLVVKPREGRGSRNIHINPKNPASFDDTYVIQELLEGPEITSTFYVQRTGELLGMITFVRALESGNTVKAEVTFEYDQEIGDIIKRTLAYFKFQGSFNIQSIVTQTGIVPFEINCRISGTNSIRSQFGFKDVEYTVQEYLLGQLPTPPVVSRGSALRVMLDIIYPDTSMSEIGNNKDQFYIR